MQKGYATVFGGSGFLGTYVVRALAEQGYMVQVISRHPNAGLKAKVAGGVGQISCVYGNVLDKASVDARVKGSEVVINLVGLLYEKGKQSFEKVHVEASKHIAQACKKHGVKRYLHMSALGVDRSDTSRYAQTKFEAEKQVLKAFPDTTIFRPSIIIGAEDNFFNMFAKMAKFSPVLPLVGGGKTRFQPVYVDDVSQAFINALSDNATKGNVYELAGPDIYTFKELLEMMLRLKGISRALVPLPFPVATLKAHVLALSPKPLLTPDQVRLLKTDNVKADKTKGFKELGIEPAGIEPIAARYLAA